MTIPDPIAELVALLSTDTAVLALVDDDRVFGGGLPDHQGMPQAAVVVKPAGGPGRHGFQLLRRTRVDTICYGATLKESWQVHCAVREALETLRRGDGPIMWVSTVSDGVNALDPATQWPTCFATYTVGSTTHS